MLLTRQVRTVKRSAYLLAVIILILLAPWPLFGQGSGETCRTLPLDMDMLERELSHVRGTSISGGGWPRTIAYEHEVHDFRENIFHREKRTFFLEAQPLRIIPHSVGVAEILWAICPRERLIAFNELSADPDSSFIAKEVAATGRIFKSRQTERVIGLRPDLIFTVFYSQAEFREKLKQAKIPYFDLGYFGSIESIKEQILVIGRVIGEEGNARALAMTIDRQTKALQERLPNIERPMRALYYDVGGYIPGKASNFSSICDMIKVVNVGAEQGIKSWSRIDHETLLKWNPDIIMVAGGNGLKEQLMANEVLSHARAVKNGRVYEVPGAYLTVSSQYMLLSANLLAGMVYEKAFQFPY
jgi:iron complex transport system substrate-binding protein